MRRRSSNPAEPYQGLAYRSVEAEVAEGRYEIEDQPIGKG
jgi:hypothetical protein